MTRHASEASSASLRWAVYWLLIALALGSTAGRIVAVNSVDRASLERHLQRQGREDWQQQRPFLSSNDRSRWATVRSLVEQGTYAIDEIVSQPNWDTIDMVKHKDRQGVARLYSSKPPLLATLIAGPYWLIHRATGTTLGTHPYEIGRLLLVCIHGAGLWLMFWLLARLVERCGASDFSRLFVIAAGTFGTFLTPFAVVLNNHLIAAVSATVSLFALIPIWFDGERRTRYFVLAGLATAFTAANELPAALWLALVSMVVLIKAPRSAVTAYLPAVLLVAAAFLGTNWIAHHSLRPPYMHQSATDPEDNWYHYTFMRGGRERQSYWIDPQGIDAGEAARSTYALHTLVGHHGIFSLTPVWLLSVLGMSLWCLGRKQEDSLHDVTRSAELTRPPDPETSDEGTAAAKPIDMGQLRQLAMLILATSVVCVIFYLMRPQPQRNYGGMTSGFRWMFWMAPMWLLAMLPALDRLQRWWAGRAIALLLLALSALSAAYPTWNPWTHPWIMNLLIHLEVVSY